MAAAPVTVAVDAMSGDHGHLVAVDAALSALHEHASLHLILVGDEKTLHAAFHERHTRQSARLRLQHASEVVGMDELPSKALRGKKDSSMRVAVDLVKEGRAQAAVSAGNTGALMGISRFVLKMLPGIERPAIITAIPSIKGHTHVLDLGANTECTAEQLLQFAVMGSALVTALDGHNRPRVALLNIGEEEIKGNETIKQAAALIAASGLNYVGFVEGDGIFLQDVDVVVCDGFVGNVALKSAEGAIKLARHVMKQEFTKNQLTKARAYAAKPVLENFAKRMDPRGYNGAALLGLQGTVIKSHGSADAYAFARAIGIAVKEVQQGVPARISHLLAAARPASPIETAVPTLG
jgi:glycerol-3-phosphate acyltransferase PlsX